MSCKLRLAKAAKFLSMLSLYIYRTSVRKRSLVYRCHSTVLRTTFPANESSDEDST